MKKIKKEVYLTEEQIEYLKEKGISPSKYLRKKIEEERLKEMVNYISSNYLKRDTETFINYKYLNKV